MVWWRRVFQTQEWTLWANFMLIIGLGVMYIVASAGMIAFNKYLVHPARFPFAVPLVLMHMAFGATCSALLFVCRPSLFPSISDPATKIKIDSELILKGALPIAFLFSGQLVLGNTAYLHSTVAFLQMLKEANLVLVYSLSLVAALEKFSWRSSSILVCVLLATCLTIRGEVNFSKQGFLIQGTSQLFESAKIVLSSMLLSNAGKKLDALTYVLLVTPLCFMVLGVVLCLLLFVWPNEHFRTPQWGDLVAWWPVLLANACVSFFLNVSIALFVKYSSAVAFILAGVAKDAMIVLVGGLLLKEVVTGMQVVGFALQLMGILIYMLMKAFPEKFEAGLFNGLTLLLWHRHGGLAKDQSQAGCDYGAASDDFTSQRLAEQGRSLPSRAAY